MVECLGLRLGAGRSSEGSLRLSGRGCRRQKLNLFADGAAEILEGLLDVGRVIVGLVRVLGAGERIAKSASQHPIMTRRNVNRKQLTSQRASSGEQP